MNIDSKKMEKFARKWLKNGETKFYFKNLESFFGLKFISIDNVNIDQVRLDGYKITIEKGLDLRNKLSAGRVWFDFETEQFEFDGLDHVIANCIIDEIRNKINGDDYK
ncbi:MAG: hypothetical protein [Caudoviricetes sp.]|nr:MAG: hypothetical protein [Caudoviricetes sp.]